MATIARVRYPVESFTAAERALLEPHFTNLDRPVFALVNLPETVKGALFARYSRYPGTLRRLFLEEFADDLPAGERPFDGIEGERAAGLYERVFIGYGDDSIAQVGGAHVACEWVSNVLTKLLQRGRLAAYLEQSTRYIPYDQPIEGGGGLPLLLRRRARPRSTRRRWTSCSRSTRAASRPCRPGRPSAGRATTSSPSAPGAARSAPRRSTCCAGCCPPRPSATSASTPRARPTSSCCCGWPPRRCPRHARYGEMLLAELEHVIPSFVARVDRPDRGGDWIEHLRERREATERAVARLGLDRREGDARAVGRARPRRRHRGRPAGARRCTSRRASPEAQIRSRIAALDPIERAELIGELAGERRNRRHRPGRGWEAVRYRFEIVSDYGGFRDLQRHRMLTCQWQRLGPELGAGVPDEVREAGAGDEYERALELSRIASSSDSRPRACADAAPYALCLGYRIRYVLDLNAREAMHLCELRSGREGHPTYRAVAQAMHERIAAVHPAVAAAMVPRRLHHRAPPRADPERDPHPPQARRRRPGDRRAARRQHPAASGARGRSGGALLAAAARGRGRGRRCRGRPPGRR